MFGGYVSFLEGIRLETWNPNMIVFKRIPPQNRTLAIILEGPSKELTYPTWGRKIMIFKKCWRSGWDMSVFFRDSGEWNIQK